MRFGLLYEHQLPRPWEPDSEHRLLHEALEQIELADRLGFDSAWAVEHHFLEEYSHSSASDVFLAAASQRTSRIRLGFGILPLPPGYQHPARVAEAVATLDLVSDGRVEFGTGETSSGAELGGFGVDRATKRAQWEEALDVVTRMLVEEPFAGADGTYVTMPPRNVVPKPRQKPHPPLWVACSRRETIRLAAEKGVGALSFSFVEPEEAKAWVDEYHEIIASERCVPGGFAVNPQIAVALPMMVHADEAEAVERGLDGAHFFAYALAHYYVFGDHAPGVTDLRQEFLERRALFEQRMGPMRAAIGTPAQVSELVARYEAVGVDEMIFVLQAGKTRHEHICEALELFAAEVMPPFKERAAAREAAKQERLAGAVAAALQRRAPARPAPAGYTYGPQDSGPAVVGPAAGNGTVAPSRGAALRRGGEAAFRAFVRRSDDRRLERTIGSAQGLRVIFGGMTSAFAPERAGGFNGDIGYELRAGDGSVRTWTVSIGADGARARPGSGAPRLTIKMTLANFIRLAARDLDAGTALLEGRMDLEGDFSLAARLGEMFGQPSS